MKVFGVMMVIGVGFAVPACGAHMPGPMWPVAGSTGLLGAFLAALAAALWAYDGWEGLNLGGSGGENPQRNIPRALVGGGGVGAVCYLVFRAGWLEGVAF